jgi:hypothetical protein
MTTLLGVANRDGTETCSLSLLRTEHFKQEMEPKGGPITGFQSPRILRRRGGGVSNTVRLVFMHACGQVPLAMLILRVCN